MFLDVLMRRNPQLIKTSFQLHRDGTIYPNTYVIDVDGIKENAKRIKKAGDENGIILYAMTKQIGRNPYLAKIIVSSGVDKFVAVDPWEAITLGKNGIKIGNVGNLVQIPSNMIEYILKLNPEVVTVFSLEKAEEVSSIAEKLGRRQDILLKIVGKEDMIYEGQVGGFKEEELVNYVGEIQKLSGVKIVGVTSFPCLLFNDERQMVEATENVNTLKRAVKVLQNEFGIEIEQINMPSATCASTIPIIKELGGTHGEPGHGFTGTTPYHANYHLSEVPSILYVSEVSHIFENRAYTFGGGFYRRSNVKSALVGSSYEEFKNNILKAEANDPEAIDYYGSLIIDDKNIKVGDTVIYAFRTQIFVTRSEIALVEGIAHGSPRLVGVYDSLGNRLR